MWRFVTGATARPLSRPAPMPLFWSTGRSHGPVSVAARAGSPAPNPGLIGHEALPDVVADNASSARFVLGPTSADPKTLDLSLVGCLLEDGPRLVATAAGAAVMGHPAEAVALLANFLGRQGPSVEAGWVILSGGLTAAVELVPGSHVTATFGHLGRVGIRAVA